MDTKEKEKKERLALQKRFGEHLIKIRESKGLTASEVARRCFMERSHMSRLEKGGRNPSLHLLKKLSDALEISLGDLMNGFQ